MADADFIIDYIFRWMTADYKLSNRPKWKAFRVLRKERRILFTVFLIAVGYIITTALIMFNLEDSEMFGSFFDALYWATTTLTTVGYGDIYPETDIGRVISMFSAVFGIAVIALPSGVITASYLDELREEKKNPK